MNALDLCYGLAGLITAPLWMRKARQGWPERMGHVAPMLSPERQSQHAQNDTRPRVLIHAVSVGEVSALRTLIPLLEQHTEPIISVTTDTGLARARALYADRCDIVRYPLDFSRSVNRFLDTIQPAAVALVELEVWPNFIKACERRSIPVCVINGRLSASSFKGYRNLRPLIGPTFCRLAIAGTQDDTYADRFREMGTPEVTVAGSMKWDNAPTESDPARTERARTIATQMGIEPNGPPITIAVSTGPAEERLIAKAAAGLDTRLIIAPRKPERFDEAALALKTATRRSSRQPADPSSRLWLLDSIGELGDLLAIADIAIIGRSFHDAANPQTPKPLGGSDPTEPIGLGAAAIAGPDMANFATIADQFTAANAMLAAKPEGLNHALADLINNPTKRQSMVKCGRRVIAENQGASQRYATTIATLANAIP